MPAKNKSVVKNASLAKVIETSLENLGKANANGTNALANATKIGKKLSAESKRLNKKRQTLSKRRNSAAAKARKDPVADNKNALKKVDKELAAVKKGIAKIKPVKAANSAELSGLRNSCRRLAAYGKALVAADIALNKPKKKAKKRKAK